MSDSTLLAMLERYYDLLPRAVCDAEAVGPFTLFVAREGWPYYARPELGSDARFTASHVHAVLARQRELGVPRHLEWVHETTPSMLSAARDAGLTIQECALMVLGELVATNPAIDGVVVRTLQPTDSGFATSRAAVDAGFNERDDLTEERVLGTITARVDEGLMRVAGAFDAEGRAIGGGSHGPRGEVTELTGIAVVPSWRHRGIGAALTVALARDAQALGVTTVFLSAASEPVARVYARVGFVRIGTACIAERAA